MSGSSAEQLLRQRIEDRQQGWMDIRSSLQHFALINYTLPEERLRPHISERFEIARFEIEGQPLAMLSVVPFLDADFNFYRLLPFARFRFGQTNHRVYVIDRATGEPCVWFFGTTLGSWVVHLSRWLWRIPWHTAKYQFDCEYDSAKGRYARFHYRVESSWCEGEVDVEDTGSPVGLLPGFESLAQLKLVLTHPVTGYFHRLDGRLGTYSVWHDEIPLTVGRCRHAYFSLYERLGLLSREEMLRPHSVLISPETLFEVHMPPRRADESARAGDVVRDGKR